MAPQSTTMKGTVAALALAVDGLGGGLLAGAGLPLDEDGGVAGGRLLAQGEHRPHGGGPAHHAAEAVAIGDGPAERARGELEAQLGPAQGQHRAVGERRLRDGHAVDHGAVAAAEIADGGALAGGDLAVEARDRRIAQHQIGEGWQPITTQSLVGTKTCPLRCPSTMIRLKSVGAPDPRSSSGGLGHLTGRVGLGIGRRGGGHLRQIALRGSVIVGGERHASGIRSLHEGLSEFSTVQPPGMSTNGTFLSFRDATRADNHLGRPTATQLRGGQLTVVAPGATVRSAPSGKSWAPQALQGFIS
jgi:hypothetical protein